MATVAEAERKGILLSLEALTQDDNIVLLSDSQAAIDTVMNLSLGQPPRSDIELAIKTQLRARNDRDQDTATAWVRAHIQIPGNEEADSLARHMSYLGEVTGSTRTVTEGGIRAKGKAERSKMRRREGFRLGTATEWPRQALSAYTWTRTNRGPHKEWLHHIGRAENPYCTCDHSTIQSGEHIVFVCTSHSRARRTLIPGKQSWQDLDSPRWIKTGPNKKEDGVMKFFEYLFHQLT